MALEGKISEFGIADIIQLISQQQKSGVLVVERKGELTEVEFSNGQITGTRPQAHLPKHPLGQMLVRAQMLSEEHLDSALLQQQKNYEYLGQILIKQGLMDQDRLERALLTQIEETFFDILQLHDGTYTFLQKDIGIDPTLGYAPTVESTLLDVLRMIDEWPDLNTTAKTPGTVLMKVADTVPEALDADYEMVYELVDGANTVQEIIDRSLLGRFGACKKLSELMAGGYITIAAAKAKKARGRRRISYDKLVGFLSYCCFVAVLGVLAVRAEKLPKTIFPAVNPAFVSASELQKADHRVKLFHLEQALEMYRMHYGTFPDELGALVGAGILDDRDVGKMTGGAVRYARNGSRYLLETEN